MRKILKKYGMRMGMEGLLLCILLGVWTVETADKTDMEQTVQHVSGSGLKAGESKNQNKNSGQEGSKETDKNCEGEGIDEPETSGEGPESETDEENEKKEDYIRWVDFNVCTEALSQALKYDVDTYGQEAHVDWVELLAYLAAGYGGDFSRFKSADMAAAVEKIQEQGIDTLTAEKQYYDYYYEAYSAVLGGMVGEYQTEQNEETGFETTYGLKAFAPIAKGFPYSHYDDFGVSRSYGYKRKHLGHDMMGQVGTPIIAIESGRISALGWNQYGGWRIGIDSFDGKRYYYYAHLRQNRPYAEGMKEGDIVQAGDVIGYMGRTGYSSKENVNNIDSYHLHLGLQLIFDESQKEGNNEIWIDIYPLVQFLSRHQSEAVRDDETKEWTRKYQIKDPAAEEAVQNQ